jgi:uncharacterized repeat protein (TIGR01451 family)
MSRPVILIIAVSLTMLLLKAFGSSTDGSILTRHCDRTVALTNTCLTVTVTIANAGTNTWRGFWYSEQLPSGLAVSPLGVTLNDTILTNCTFESGFEGDVCPGCTPFRCVLELPPTFLEANPVPPGSVLRIIFSLSSAVAGDFSLAQFSWAGFEADSTNAIFGYSDPPDAESLHFLSAPPPPPATVGYLDATGFQLRIQGVTGASYTVQASTNLLQWSAIATNISPFSLAPQTSAYPWRFFRSLWRP